jgi:hypothetical protein
MGTTAEQPTAAPTAAATEAPSAATAVSVVDPVKAEQARRLAEIRERNAHAAAIRGTQWGKELNGMALSAVAHYCTINRLDPARHVEVLGGKIYLLGELYMERGAPLLLKRLITMDEPDYIHEDAGINAVLSGTDKSVTEEMVAWARAEKFRRFQQRAKLGVPHDATGACVVRIRVPGTDTILVGVNWCGGSTKVKRRKNPKPGEAAEYRSDPVGDAEPTKTAHTRALRRAWRQVMSVLPEYGEDVGRLEVAAISVNATMRVESEKEAAETRKMIKNRPLVDVGDGYPPAEPVAVDAAPSADPAGGDAEDGGNGLDASEANVVEMKCSHGVVLGSDEICRECELEFDEEDEG